MYLKTSSTVFLSDDGESRGAFATPSRQSTAYPADLQIALVATMHENPRAHRKNIKPKQIIK